MQNLIKRLIELEKALHTLVMQVEKLYFNDESQVDIPRFKCPLLPPEPDIHFKGDKIELIRVILSLCLLGRFVDSKGKKVPDYKAFQAFGKWLNVDLTTYLKDLDRTKQENTSMATQTKILDRMKAAILKYFNLETFRRNK